MNRDIYIKQEIFKLTKYWGSFALISGAFLFLLLSGLDYFVTPENFIKFFFYRLICSILLIILYLFHRKIRDEKYQNIINILITVVVSSTVEIMILSFGGHQSAYYAGMIITIVFLLGIIPLPFKTSLVLVSTVYSIYLFPILLKDRITNIQIFINNSAFLLTTSMIALLWRYWSQKNLTNTIGLQYDLDKKKQELEIYSTQLEDLVAERTKDLSISEQKFRELFENANDGVVVFNKKGIIINLNQRFCELHGFEKEALIGTNIRLLDSESQKSDKKDRMNRMLSGESIVFETEHYKKDGSKILLEVSSKAIDIGGELYIQSFYRDITDKKRLQEQLFQSQKMESIGVLAGGVAHDFNNILTAILGHAELLHEYSNLDDTSLQRVKTIEGSARKAGQMISKLLSFARKGGIESLPVNINDVIKDTIELIAKVMTNRKIGLSMETDQTIPPVKGDANQMEQVIMNLLLNAADAMPNGGVINIKTSYTDLKEDAVKVHPLLTPGRYVSLNISDTGTGIPDEIKGRIFDPFFTTKGPGKGTGLGLAMVYGIVKEHKGVINVESQLGKGTTFEIYMPAFDRTFHKVEKTQIYSISGKEKILVIDDEEDVLSFIKEILEKQGYRVLVTDNPIYALDIFKQISEDINLVITDIVMPLVNGRELIKHFKIIKPKVKMIAISGYDASGESRKDKDIDFFIRKPFDSLYLLSVVRRVLDAEVMKGIDF